MDQPSIILACHRRLSLRASKSSFSLSVIVIIIVGSRLAFIFLYLPHNLVSLLRLQIPELAIFLIDASDKARQPKKLSTAIVATLIALQMPKARLIFTGMTKITKKSMNTNLFAEYFLHWEDLLGISKEVTSGKLFYIDKSKTEYESRLMKVLYSSVHKA